MNDAALIGTACPARIAAFLGGDLDRMVVERLRSDRRLAAHLERLIAGRLGAAPVLDSRQAKVLAMEPEAVRALTTRAGIVRHAAAIARRIGGAERRETVTAIGEGAYRLALEASSLVADVDMISVADPAALPAAIEGDGRRCFAGWCDAQHATVAVRLRLRHGSGDVSPDGHGVAIVGWLLDRP